MSDSEAFDVWTEIPSIKRRLRGGWYNTAEIHEAAHNACAWKFPFVCIIGLMKGILAIKGIIISQRLLQEEEAEQNIAHSGDRQAEYVH